MVKIIFCDMDGTLLTNENELPVGFDAMISELKRRNVIFAPASGRQYFSLLRSFKDYSDDFLFLAENGTFVMHKGEEVFSQPLDFEAAREVLAATEGLENILRVYCGKKDAYILRKQDTPAAHAELDKYYTHNGVVDSFSELDDIPLKIALFDPNADAEKNIYNKLAKFHENLQVVLSSDYWVDVMAPGVSKGEAVRNIQRVMNIKPEECAAFGDYFNDVEMLQAVGYGFAMANSHPDVKKLAKFVVPSNNAGGVLLGVRRLMVYKLI